MQPELFEKLPADSLRGRIARQIREAILNGNLAQGERLVERKLANALGASLTAVREAMIELEAEGFLVKTPNSATHVVNLSWPQVQKIFAVRRVVEGLAVEEACRHAPEERVRDIEETCLKMLDAARARDSRAFNRADMEFHLALWRAAENEFLEMALKRALLPYFAFGAIRILAHDSVDLLRDATLHLAILEAIRARDLEAGRRTYDAALGDWGTAARADLAAQDIEAAR